MRGPGVGVRRWNVKGRAGRGSVMVFGLGVWRGGVLVRVRE